MTASCSASNPFGLKLLACGAVGEAAGRASRTLAQHVPGPGSLEGVRGSATGVAAELARARIALDERGQRLGELDERTAAMAASAEVFSRQAYLVGTIKRCCHLLVTSDLPFFLCKTFRYLI